MLSEETFADLAIIDTSRVVILPFSDCLMLMLNDQGSPRHDR